MFNENSVKIDKDHSLILLNELSPYLDLVEFDPSTVTILSCPIPFYPGYDFIEIIDCNSMPTKSRNLVYSPNDVHVIDWNKDTILKINASVPISLNEDTLLPYVKFYFYYTSSEKGVSKIIETVEDIQWHEEPPHMVRNHIAKIISPFSFSKNPDGGFIIDCCMVFGDTIFSVNLQVEKNGSIEIIDSGNLIEKLPIMSATLQA